MVEGETPKVCLSSVDLIAPSQCSEHVSKPSRTCLARMWGTVATCLLKAGPRIVRVLEQRTSDYRATIDIVMPILGSA